MIKSNQRRQQSGFACQECRRRKVRCDRRMPSCGLCVETGILCVTIDRQAQKGVRKGQISAMRSEIASLQSQLNKYNPDGSQSPILRQTDPNWDNEHDLDFMRGAGDMEDLDHAAVDSFLLNHSLSTTTSMLGHALNAPAAAPPTSSLLWPAWMMDSRRFEDPMAGMDLPKLQPPLMSPTDMMDLKVSPLDRPPCQTSLTLFECEEHQVSSSIAMSPFMTEHERADLDQVFFDRVHPVLPLFYRRRCHGWINQPLPGTARACLRSAMRTIAAAMSAPSVRFCDQLYAETRRLLEDYTATSKETIELEYIQVWLLLGFYELLRVGESQAMLTAARCSRLVLMARLFEIDAPDLDETHGAHMSPTTPQQESHEDDSFCAVEERRRTFWLAYCLDCFLYSRNEYPPMMQEEMICTRLPAPEANFQNNQYVCTPFLAEVFAAKAPDRPSTCPSSLSECVVLATLYAQCSSQRSSRVTELPGTSRGDFWPRLKHLADAATARIQGLAAHPTHVDSDPMLLFAHMVARGAVIKLGQAATSALAWSPAEQQQQQQHTRRASAAAAEIVWLTRQIPHFSYFRAHPFLPDPLACAVSFLNAKRESSTAGLPDDDDVAHLVRVLQDLQCINSLARIDSFKVYR